MDLAADVGGERLLFRDLFLEEYVGREDALELRRSLLAVVLVGVPAAIIEMIWWTGLAPWVFEFPFPGSLTSSIFLRQNLTLPQHTNPSYGSSPWPSRCRSYQGACRMKR